LVAALSTVARVTAGLAESNGSLPLAFKGGEVSIERMCAGREFQAEGADTEKARKEKLLVIPAGLVRRFVLEERKDLGGRE